MTDLYDLEASLGRMRRVARAIDDQKIVAAQTADCHAHARAVAKLAEIEDIYQIIASTHSILADANGRAADQCRDASRQPETPIL